MKISLDRVIFGIFAYAFIIIVSILCIMPFVMMIAASFSSENAILMNGFKLAPQEFSTAAYNLVFKYPEAIAGAYGVTIFVTASGSLLGLFLMSMASYVIQRQDFKWRNQFSFYFFFTTLFSGGVVPWYILMVKYLHMKDNILALILPYLFNVFYMIILKTL